MPQPELEVGTRLNTFWRWCVDKEVMRRAKNKPGVIEDVARELQRSESGPHLSAQHAGKLDHGTVFYTLHDLHREKAYPMTSSASASSTKLPPLKGAAAPKPVGGLWKWPGGQPLPADVESAVTASSMALPSSMMSAQYPSGEEMPRGSTVSANAPRAASSISAVPPSVLQGSMPPRSTSGGALRGASTGSRR
eukprot:TRINITY_DN62255_c0_g1_i1.p1 TRINITY_DN62255_c0_g1~~TRINITY_DN62255_c0_g1_i1.p1  ORF type:complete len:193 (-),score=27.40 TRINITY_DN62255_c0_g1_i1:71-649(-)